MGATAEGTDVGGGVATESPDAGGVGAEGTAATGGKATGGVATESADAGGVPLGRGASISRGGVENSTSTSSVPGVARTGSCSAPFGVSTGAGVVCFLVEISFGVGLGLGMDVEIAVEVEVDIVVAGVIADP